MEKMYGTQHRSKLDLDVLTHYPGLRHKNRRTAGIYCQRYDYDTACVMLDNQSTLPKLFTEVVGQPDGQQWMDTTRLQLGLLTILCTREFANSFTIRNVIGTRWIFD